MITPKVSIICGYYNRPNLVRRTLDGIREQTFGDFEALVFDDASTDETADTISEIISSYKDSRFRLIRHERNVGFTRGLINAINQCRGEYIAIHDSGDVSLPRRLERQVSTLDEQPGLVVTGCHYINCVEETGLTRVRRPNANGLTPEDVRRDSTFTHGEVMYRAAAYHQAGGYRAAFRYSQDNDLWQRMIQIGQFGTVPEILYKRYVQLDGISYKPSTFAQQAAYYALGKRLAAGNGQLELLRELERGVNIFDVVSLNSPDIQRTIVRGVARAIAFGSLRQAREIATSYVTSRTTKQGLLTALSLAESRLGSTLVRTLKGISGVKPAHGTETRA